MKQPFSNKKKQPFNFSTLSQTKTPSQKTRRRKRSIFCHTKTFFAKLHENSQIPMTYTTLLIPSKDPKKKPSQQIYSSLDKKGQHNSRSGRSAPSAIRQAYGPGLEFWAQQPINTSSTHLQPITRRHLAPGDF
jgi:hypothetical protein